MRRNLLPMPYREPDEQRAEDERRQRVEAEAFREALRHPSSKSRDFGRLGLRLSSLAVAGPVGLLVLLLVFDAPAGQSRGGFLDGFVMLSFLACLALGAGGAVLGVVGLFQQGARVARCVGAIVLGVLAWPMALVVGFIAVGGAGAPGRAMRVRGRSVLPRVSRGPLHRSRRLSRYQPDLTLVPDEARGPLATLWLRDARAEHASIPAFEHLAMDLLVAGAPEPLVAAARRAALEEAGHAAICFAIASAYAGRELRASSAPFAPAWRPSTEPRRTQLRRLAVESLLDGCIGEASAAEGARRGACHALDPAIRRALERIAREEAGHAQLARAIVDWTLGEDPTIARALDDALQGHRRRQARAA
jgi:hypothetical protein